MPMLLISGKEIPCELVLFDLDGTLIDDKARYQNLAQARFEAMTTHAGREAAENWAKLSGVETSTGVVDMHGPLAKAPRKEDLTVATTAIYLTGRRWHHARELAVKAYQEADELQRTTYKPDLFHGAEEALRGMRRAGVKLGIATNGSGSAARELMKGLGIEGLFDVFTGTDEVEEGKPAPDMILLTCEMLGVEPSDTVYVGDQPTDMAAGRAAAVRATVAVNNTEEEVFELADHVLDSVADIRVREA